MANKIAFFSVFPGILQQLEVNFLLILLYSKIVEIFCIFIEISVCNTLSKILYHRSNRLRFEYSSQPLKYALLWYA